MKHEKLNPDCKVCDNEGYIEVVNWITGGKVKVPHLCLPDFGAEWEEEFEDNMFQASETYGGVYLDNNSLEKLVIKYLNIPIDDEEVSRIKIKAKKGTIVIEVIK